MTVAIIVFLTVFIGSCMQRISGMGLGLVGGPVLMLVMGPVNGILVLNVLATINALMTTLTVRKNVNWKYFAVIASVLVFGAVPGAIMVREVSPDWLLLVAGTLLLLALSVVTAGKRYVPRVEGYVPMAASGIVAGFMNTLAGIAGPAITVYSTAARWDQRMYAATLQPIFMVSGALSFIIKQFTGAGDLGTIDPAIWPLGLFGMAAGIFAGVKIAPRISRQKAHQLALALAVLGGLTAVIRGLIGLVG